MAEQSCPGSMHTAGMDCTLDGASVDAKGVLHCSYSCTVTPTKAQAKEVQAELKNLGARARAAAKEMNVNDPASVKEGKRGVKKGPP